MMRSIFSKYAEKTPRCKSPEPVSVEELEVHKARLAKGSVQKDKSKESQKSSEAGVGAKLLKVAQSQKLLRKEPLRR